MKQKLTLAAVLLAAAAPSAKADAVADAITEIGTFATSMGGAATAILGIVVIFTGIKLAKRVLGKV